ncbi:chondroitinase-B domain-containing protein [Coraliomargarita sp. SDUM461004]|uniref:Chondroitinase-B domain-containing protein n=1 Tax=Thalassobacterium sedimentorum TaxID=3041258 RepID=A0ABU1AIZ9_9BACT|nr:chondroitinase-B domain-containing protein [Coraliomargarita sp. SDUM461004]MDQ8194802.1 chondroitinase-B domain-containing protein [Coraliomargarita sp. SDUM461004]
MNVIHGYPEGVDRVDIVPGDLVVDTPTLENLGFRWFVEGDRNSNATVEVAYRRKGEVQWSPGLSMLRINHEIAARHQGRDFRTENLFAGSIMFLQPDTDYQVKFIMHDPDGGAPDEAKIINTRTRSEPLARNNGNVIHVYPVEHPDYKLVGSKHIDIREAFDTVQAGDLIYLHEGIHSSGDLPIILKNSGSRSHPIVIRGAGAGKSIIEGEGLETDIFRIPGASHLIFEDLTLRTANAAIRTSVDGLADSKGPGASWLTVRRCHIENVRIGIWTYSQNSKNWYIADNIITGIDEEWYPRPRSGYMDGSHTGINVYGQGHVVCHNRISGFSDSIAIANYYPPSLDIHKQALNIDFYNNDVSCATDDTIEADYGCHNIRIYNNLCYNAHTGISVQPAYGGPVYLIRNEIFGISELSFKWNMAPSGVIAYHNTLVSAGVGFRSPLWSNSHLKNNLILAGQGRGALYTGALDPNTSTMNYNGWFADSSLTDWFRWRQSTAETTAYSSLEAFRDATGYETDGIMVDYDDFVGLTFVEPGRSYLPSEFDIRLNSNAKAVDVGAKLSNVNDNYTGSAPDLGAIEYGSQRPQYGPREN